MAVGESVLAAFAVAVGAVATSDPGRISPQTAMAVGLLAAVVGGMRLIISPPLSVHETDLFGKTAIVTGGNSGVGKETVRVLAKWGATVILACRDVEKGEKAKAEILGSLPKRSRGSVLVWCLDLADFSSVRRFCSRFRDSGRPLHMLINNGGVRHNFLQVTTDGIEEHYQVNHLSHVLLTMELLPMRRIPEPSAPPICQHPELGDPPAAVRSSAPSRIVHVSSSAHAFGEIEARAYGAEVLNKDKAVFEMSMKNRLEGVYGDTKLMQVVFSEELQSRLKAIAPGVESFSVHPGFVATNFGGGDTRWLQTMLVLTRPLLARSANQGAMSVVYAATSSKVKGLGGGYISDCKVVKRGAISKGEDARWLWEESLRILGLPAIITK
mmetsp:Transcript_36540/g.85338  ORF Transcript_36540/g.85338 Transcript_36540/m.85338 type:complete len:383 (-) Transcript_36540:204-1352(-)